MLKSILLISFIFCFLFLIIYWFIKWILRKTNLCKKKYRWLIALPTSLILSPFALLGILFLTFTIYENWTPDRDFNKERWENNVNRRFVMANSIINNDLLTDKTPEEITSILGERQQYFIPTDNSKRIIYLLGNKKADFYYMEITFENGKVSSVDIKTDNGQMENQLNPYEGP